ncbi:thiamine pyrophosphate-binding protein [Burkholderia thailandensis]|uniref:Thiamine pyrophosphate enzyme, central domain protein n=1 Tax=Burkholderia thailandensis TaxID=57975 RepID=A0AAW9CS84_BURTH|nr:thiamine pyrophosphate-binding protein [Burkholderia thailandensis]AHI67782.1 thiamine pyrophosphate enzyme, central domain protein [Burkholderia thailandensis H0587]AVR27350.1 thiamine pyrophosphate-binding protein [Burkholderia thailandensis]MCS3393225.1 thiamine pyrophosphate-binding protein [Burkholderia thailandensis]MCS6426201.1 thiamine pyrophosphate-binding protein [Burkholderia thailandensis]MCS6455532.1 thiamine pyrophosphate-binding protein [Burkholderia thailandensis]
MKASDAIARFLAAHDVRHCFELVGGMITHLLDSFARSGRFHIVSMHHEQAAAFAAEGVARRHMGRKVAVALGTSGPGATNLITGVGSCWMDSIPCLFITGQVNTHELKGDRAIRQQGFQELDIVPMVRSITKRAVQVSDASELLPELHGALSMALSGRQGPVLIDIPNDVQRAEIPDAVVDRWLNEPLRIRDRCAPDDRDIDAIRELCRSAARPLVCFGGGARWAPSMPAWIAALEAARIPYVGTLMAHERVVAGAHYFNMIGAYGNREANWAVQNCDLLIVIGARLDVRQTGADIGDFARHARVVQIDIDPAQLNNRVKTAKAVCCDAESFFRRFAVRRDTFAGMRPDWVDRLVTLRAEYVRDEYPDWSISPGLVFARLNEAMAGKAVHYVCDVGNHQMWAAQGLRLGDAQAAHYSGGMGAMGFALPAAIGIACSGSGSGKTIVITGDGSLQINVQELDTLNRLQLDVAVVVMNNYSLGMVKNFQDMYFDGKNISTKQGYSCPSFVELARAYGIESVMVDAPAGLQGAIDMIAGSSRPLLIEIAMPEATECRPRLAFGRKLDDQYPKIG